MAKIVRFGTPRRGRGGARASTEKTGQVIPVPLRAVNTRGTPSRRGTGASFGSTGSTEAEGSASVGESRFAVNSGARTAPLVLKSVVLKSVEVLKHVESKGDKARRYKQRARVLLHQAAALLSELDPSEQRLAWLLEDCADLLVRVDQSSDARQPQTRDRLRGAAKKNEPEPPPPVA